MRRPCFYPAIVALWRLSERPVWLFSSGPLGTDVVDEQGHDVLETTRPREFDELHDLVDPRGERVFFGAWAPTRRRQRAAVHGRRRRRHRPVRPGRRLPAARRAPRPRGRTRGVRSSTIVFPSGRGSFVRFRAVPSRADAPVVLDALRTLADDAPELAHLEPLRH